MVLTLLDIQPMLGAVEGVCMELQDCAFPLLKGLYLHTKIFVTKIFVRTVWISTSILFFQFCFSETIPTADEKEAFIDIDAAILVGAFPRKQGMERKDLLQRNAKIFESQGKSLDQYAKKSVKVILN